MAVKDGSVNIWFVLGQTFEIFKKSPIKKVVSLALLSQPKFYASFSQITVEISKNSFLHQEK